MATKKKIASPEAVNLRVIDEQSPKYGQLVEFERSHAERILRNQNACKVFAYELADERFELVNGLLVEKKEV